MSVNRGTPDDPLKKLEAFGERELWWLERHLETQGHKIPETRGPRSVRVSTIGQILIGSSNPALSMDYILSELKELTVADRHLKWITQGNHRLLIWLLEEAWIHIGDPESPENAGLQPKFLPKVRSLLEIPPQDRYLEFIRAIDGWFVEATKKEKWLKQRQEQWGALIENDKRYLKWLEGSNKGSSNQLNKVQLEWALQYLQDHNKILAVPRHHSNEELYAIVAAIIDRLSPTPDSAEKRLFIEQMKKSWSQKKYRDAGKAKKPYHLLLTLDVKEKLDWLSTKTGYRTTDILAALINQEYEQYKKGRRWVIVEKSEK